MRGIVEALPFELRVFGQIWHIRRRGESAGRRQLWTVAKVVHPKDTGLSPLFPQRPKRTLQGQPTVHGDGTCRRSVRGSAPGGAPNPSATMMRMEDPRSGLNTTCARTSRFGARERHKPRGSKTNPSSTSSASMAGDQKRAGSSRANALKAPTGHSSNRLRDRMPAGVHDMARGVRQSRP